MRSMAIFCAFLWYSYGLVYFAHKLGVEQSGVKISCHKAFNGGVLK